jgi:hypothetical protein
LHPSYIERSLGADRLADEEPSEWSPAIQAQYVPNAEPNEYVTGAIKACRLWRVRAQLTPGMGPFTGCRVRFVDHGHRDRRVAARERRYRRCVARGCG